MQTYDEYSYDLKKNIASGKSVCVQFSASWCGPCKRITPEIKKLAVEMPHITFFYVDVDDCPEISSEKGFSVSQLPTFVFCKGGSEVVQRVTGANLNAVGEALTRL
jgi:thioredoxin 1